MTATMVWLFAFVALYWVYCTHWGVASARMEGSADDFFLAGRQLPAWIFVLSATVISFSGWAFIGQPALIFRDGFQFSYLAMGAIVIPLTGVLFLKRQWILGKRFGYVTPGEMFSHYFESEALRLLVVLIALVFAIPFVGLQLAASGYLIQVLSNGAIAWSVAMWVLTSVVFLYVCLGGLRAVAYIGTLQCLFLGAGLVMVGSIAYFHLGGFGTLVDALAKLGSTGIGPWGSSAQGYNAYFEIPGVIQFTEGMGREAPGGGIWTASMILTYCFALMGIQAAPAFTMWAFSSRDPKGFAPQQVWASAGVIGILLLFFTVGQGMGAHFLGASAAVNDAGLAIAKILPELEAGRQSGLVAHYIATVAERSPWLMALLAVCAIAAIQGVTAAYASTTGTMVARDIYRRYFHPEADSLVLRFVARVAIGLIMLAALLLATYAPRAQVELGSLALSFGFQLVPALAAICWFSWITRQGVIVGLVAGLVAVIFTEPLGATLTEFFGFPLPWGRWPWTIHSAGWGIFFNVIFCVIVSWISKRQDEREHRNSFHAYFSQTSALTPEKRFLRPTAWALSLGWLFFAIGPGAVLGNDLFGPPNQGVAAWSLGLPSIWAWQILWWALGVLVLWFLAYKMEFSVMPRTAIEPLSEEAASSTAVSGLGGNSVSLPQPGAVMNMT